MARQSRISSVVLSPVDALALAMNLFFALMHLLFIDTPDFWAVSEVNRNLIIGLGFVACNGVVLGFARLDASGRIRQGGLVHFLRVFYVQFFYGFWFMQSIYLSQLVAGGRSLDPLFYRLEELVFGVQLAVLVPQRFGHLTVLNEVFYFAYFIYYLIVAGGWWLLFARNRYEEAGRALFIVTASFSVLYVWFVFFPVHGPKYFIPDLHARWYSDLDGYLFAWIMRRIFSDANLAGAAVPSSHVAMSAISLILLARYLPRLLLVAVPVTILVWISTVYLYAHYAVDVVLGLLVVPLLLLVSTRLHARLHRLLVE